MHVIYLCVGKRIVEVEEQLSKVEEKKKRDLENLKKQNERIAIIQVGCGYGIYWTILHMYTLYVFTEINNHTYINIYIYKYIYRYQRTYSYSSSHMARHRDVYTYTYPCVYVYLVICVFLHEYANV
jgi:hypothetical protein